MPEAVGNEANHKTGEKAPKIQLGLNVLATQVEAEYDSFGNSQVQLFFPINFVGFFPLIKL